jgi:hypothetical protein
LSSSAPAPIYDGSIADENFLAKPAGVGWVSGSPTIPMKVGLNLAGGDTPLAIEPDRRRPF